MNQARKVRILTKLAQVAGQAAAYGKPIQRKPAPMPGKPAPMPGKPAPKPREVTGQNMTATTASGRPLPATHADAIARDGYKKCAAGGFVTAPDKDGKRSFSP